MPDFHKTWRKDMHKETANEFKSGNRHGFPLIVIFVVAPLELDLPVIKVQDAVVRNGDAMCVSPEVLDDGISGFKRRLAIDDPFFLIASIEQIQEMLWIMQISLLPEEIKF